MTPERTLEIRRMLLEAFVEPKRVYAPHPSHHPDYTEIGYAAEQGLLDLDEYNDTKHVDQSFTDITIIADGNVPAPIGLADASIAIGAAVDTIAVQRGASRDDVLKMLAVVALRIAARDA